MARDPYDNIKVYLAEKIIINFALPSDLIWHSLRALASGDRSQTLRQRIAGLWYGKIRKYQKLLRVKAENGGRIPDDYRELCRQTPCGYVRLMLTYLRNPALNDAPSGSPEAREA